jgi:membrane-bound metal-dependent hydrolase YbcI (DUF457 family)
MASPLGHSLISFILARTERTRLQAGNRFAWYAFAILAGNAPDLDFLPGLLLDEPFRFHRGATHSLVAACAFGGIVYFLARRMTPRAGALALLGFSCYSSHLVLDLPAVPLCWPFFSSHAAIALPSIGEAINWERAGSTANFIEVLFSMAFVQTMVVEALVLLPALLAVWALGKSRNLAAVGGKGMQLLRPTTTALRQPDACVSGIDRPGDTQARPTKRMMKATALES